MIYYFGDAYDLDGNIAQAYNSHIELVPRDEDWIVLTDADFMFLTPSYGHIISEYLRRYKGYKLWTVYTNRVACRPQLQKDMFYELNIRKHKERAKWLGENKKYSIKEIKRVISGYCMIFQKKTWKEMGRFRGSGLFGIDTRFSHDILVSGEKIGLMEAVYGFHFYRADNKDGKTSPYKDPQMNEQLKEQSGWFKD